MGPPDSSPNDITDNDDAARDSNNSNDEIGTSIESLVLLFNYPENKSDLYTPG